MTSKNRSRSALACLLLTSAAFAPTLAAAQAQHQAGPATPALRGAMVPTGQRITPDAMPGSVFAPLNPNLTALPDFTAGQAAAVAISPDGATMLVLTSGYNRNYGPTGDAIPELSNEYVFVYDIKGPQAVKRQVVQVPNTFLGIAWHPDGQRFYVAGGVDDVVHEFALKDGAFALAGSIALGHAAGVGIKVKPQAAGLAVSPDGAKLLVANYQNESVSLIDTAGKRVLAEADLRPGVIDPAKAGAPGGTYPNLVAFVSGTKAYVTSQRDRELISLDVTADSVKVAGRQSVAGQPAAIVLNPQHTRAYVALDNTDRVIAVDTASDVVLETIAITAPAAVWRNPEQLQGANPNGLALAPDGRTLFVTEGGLNALGVVELGTKALDPDVVEDATPNARIVLTAGGADDAEDAEAGVPSPASRVVGLVPTGWYPTSVGVARDGRHVFVANGKSNAGPAPEGCRNALSTAKEALFPCADADQYVWQLEKGGLLTLPMPQPRQLAQMTWQVAENNSFTSVADHRDSAETMAFVRSKIDHVIYIVKENRTYDQVLGDLEVGNGDPSLVLLPEPISPNHHALARNFVTLDAFFDSGESSNTGWNWSTAARTTDFTERTAPVNYADRGLQYDWEGTNRNINVGIPTLAARREANPATPDDPNVLAGTADVAAPDGPGEGRVGTGYLWDAALGAGLSVRNYGFYGDDSLYDPEGAKPIPLVREPHKDNVRVFYATKQSLEPHSDPFFRTFDMAFPDFWRLKEWEREFDAAVASGELPKLTLLRLPHDHFGDFGTAIDGVNTVETQMADNDYAIGMVAERVAASPFAGNTLIFMIEDDSQDGADHVDPHRSLAYVVGPYVRQHAVVSTPYTTVSMVRTIEDVLGLPPLGLNDGLAEPMAAVFDPDQVAWSYQAAVPEVLRTTALPLPPAGVRKADAGCFAIPTRTAAYWGGAMAGQNFASEDRLDTARFNAALWRGLKGTEVPAIDRGADLSRDRAPLLAAFRTASGCAR